MEEERDITIWSPGALTRDYFHCLYKTYDDITDDKGEAVKRQQIFLTIITAVSVIETFMNIYLDIVANEKKIPKKALKNPKGQETLDFKIRKWPKIIFGKDLNFSQAPFSDFIVLKKLRNDLVHFKAKRVTHEIMERIRVTSFDFSTYYSLDISHAHNAILTAIETIKELCRLNGIEEEKINGQLYFWTGYFEDTKKV